MEGNWYLCGWTESDGHFSARPHPDLLPRGENSPKVFSRIEALNLTTPLPSLSSPSEGEERVADLSRRNQMEAEGQERSGPGWVHGEDEIAEF